jgi:Zn-dependent protease
VDNQLVTPPQPDWLPPQTPTPVAAPAHAPATGPPPATGNDAFGQKRKRAGGGILAALLALAAKGKALLLLLPKIKLLATGGTALVSIAAYTLLFGLPFAIGLVALLLVHEMGHVIALRREGIKASAPMFIPFFGAVVMASRLGDDAAAEARVGLAGPLLGSVGAAACLVIHQATGSLFWQQLAYVGFFINLFNLIPVTPFDGGRAMAALAPALWFVGLAVMIALGVAFRSPFVILFAILGGFDVYHRWGQIKKGGEQTQSYYRVPPQTRTLIAAVYIGLIVLLAWGMDITFVSRHLS